MKDLHTSAKQSGKIRIPVLLNLKRPNSLGPANTKGDGRVKFTRECEQRLFNEELGCEEVSSGKKRAGICLPTCSISQIV